jgi:predicted enzyme related to lactoylglutathione lyase
VGGDAGLRIELFPADLDRFIAFYVQTLHFDVLVDQRDAPVPYVHVQRGRARIGAVQTQDAVDSGLRSVPQGVEIVIEVNDLEAERDALIAAGYQLAEDVRDQPWGLRDFRIFDPDGYYLRFTTTRSG